MNRSHAFVLASRLKPLFLSRRSRGSSSTCRRWKERIWQPTKTTSTARTGEPRQHAHAHAADYAADGIYMTSVDTGWITDEAAPQRGQVHAELLHSARSSTAWRVYDPIACGVSEPGRPASRCVLKDYALTVVIG